MGVLSSIIGTMAQAQGIDLATLSTLTTDANITVRTQDGEKISLELLLDGAKRFDPATFSDVFEGTKITNANGASVPVDNGALEQFRNILREGQMNQLSQMLIPYTSGYAPNSQAGSGSGNRDASKSAFANKGKIIISPSVIAIKPGHDTAVFRFINPSGDSIPLDFVVRHTLAPQSTPISATPLGNPVNEPWSMAQWIHNVPKDVILTPHETLTVKMPITVPQNTVSGTYSAHILVYYKAPIKIDASTDLSGDGLSFLADTTANGFPQSRFVAGKLVYTKGSSKPPTTNTRRRK